MGGCCVRTRRTPRARTGRAPLAPTELLLQPAPSAGVRSRLGERALVLDLLQGAQEERLVDATLEYRHTELHALRDYLAPVHASFSSELGGRQVDRHTVSPLSG